MLGGVLVAHTLAFRLTVPAATRPAELAATGHAWFAWLPLLLAGATALLVLGLVRRALHDDVAHPAAWPFALFPPLALFLQEQLERGAPALDTTIAAGMLLAIPLGLAAYAVLRGLLKVADALVATSVPARPRLPLLVITNPSRRVVHAAVAARSARGPPRRAR
jgi:hypothetical protein